MRGFGQAMGWIEGIALFAGGLVAGVINTLAGGGSWITVPLLVLFGLTETAANATNRVGVLASSATALHGFTRHDVPPIAGRRQHLPALLLGGALGALLVTQMNDRQFGQMFGLVMLGTLALSAFPSRKSPQPSSPAQTNSADNSHSAERTTTTDQPGAATTREESWTTTGKLFLTGLYGGAVQAGVGILLGLAFAGSTNLLKASRAKVEAVLVLTSAALLIFTASGAVHWPQALVLGAGFAAGGRAGAELAWLGGNRLLQAALAIAVIALAGMMLGLYGPS